jgi:SET domain-containing protein
MGDFIAYYQGRKISNAEADKRSTRYMFELNSRWTIDGASRRNLARYINHSCRANAESDVKKGKIIITARKTIRPDDEITIDYGRDYFDTFIKAKGCRCAACGAKSMVLRSPAKPRSPAKGSTKGSTTGSTKGSRRSSAKRGKK